MPAANRDILAAPVPGNDLRNPTCLLKLWAKCTRTNVNRSKADANTVIHRTQEWITHYFRYQRKKKPATPTHPSTHPLPSTTVHQLNKTYLERPAPFLTPHQLHRTFQFVMRHLGAVAKGPIYSIHTKGGRNLGAFIFKIGFSV